MSDDSSFFGGMNLLDGLPSRRAGTILFAIEGRTAQLATQAKQALVTRVGEKSAADQESAFLAAIAQGRDLPYQPSIQEIERYAPEWAGLVPADAGQRAALARKLGEKYRFRRQDATAIRQALGLDDEAVAQSFERLFQAPLDSIYTPAIRLRERARWAASHLGNRLERLPPFWTAYSLTLTETVGGSILALPIALAGVGPLPGLILLVVFGLVNIFTVMGIVEAITRNGNMRYGTAYFGRLVDDFLGRPGSATLVPSLLLLNILTLLAFYVGISTTLAAITGISPLLWPVLLFLAAVYYLRRDTLSATVASAMVIGIINILIIIVLSVLAVPYIQPANLAYTNLPLGSGQPVDAGILEMIFGVVLVAFFGHTSAGNAAKVVLRRDPGGRSLIWGNIGAIATAIALYSLWVLAVNGAIAPAELASQTGTAIAPLATMIGGVVPFLGVVYVVLAMGMGTIHISYSLFFQVQEMLPTNVKRLTQFLASLAPIAGMLLVVEWMLFTQSESFSSLLGVMGVVTMPLVGGVFPILMLVASRRSGEYLPGYKYGFLGNPLLLAAVYLIYLGGVFVYGIFIYSDPLDRVVTIGAGLVILVMTVLVVRQKAFATRTVVELRVQETDTGEQARLAVVSQGKPLAVEACLDYPDGEQILRGAEMAVPSFKRLKKLVVRLENVQTRELKVWLHRVTPEGHSAPLQAAVWLREGERVTPLDDGSQDGQVLTRPPSPSGEVELRFGEPDPLANLLASLG